MGLEIRPVGDDDEFRAFLEVDALAFATEVRDQEVPFADGFLERDRTAAAFVDGQLVGASGNLTLELTVPGPAVVPCAGVTYVGVTPNYRRRGLLTTMMGRLLDDAVAHGEPLAALFASESVIYGRFGFGLATQTATYSLERTHAVFAHPATAPGRILFVDRDAPTVLPPIQDRVRHQTNGAVSRSAGWWARHFEDPAEWRHHKGRMFHAVHVPAGTDTADAFVTWRVEQRWEANAAHLATVHDVQAAHPQVRLALLQFVCSLDLMGEIRFEHHPVDEPLRWTLADPRRLTTNALLDGLWVRLLDIPHCLEARTYDRADRVVVEVVDRFRPSVGGTFALDTGGDRVRCIRTDTAPDLTMGVADLGAVYLGGASVATLAAAGRVTSHNPTAVTRASTLFATVTAPRVDTDF